MQLSVSMVIIGMCLTNIFAADTQKQEISAAVSVDSTSKSKVKADSAAEQSLPSLSKPKVHSEDINTIEKMQAEANKLRSEAKILRAMADTLNKASDDAENKVDEAKEKTEKLDEDLIDKKTKHIAYKVKLQVEQMKKRILADVERIKKLYGPQAANDSLDKVYKMQADSIDTILAHSEKDTLSQLDKQNALLAQIHQNSEALLEKSKEMSVKAREMEDAAKDREEMADELADKARKLAEDQNPLPLSKRFPFHFGFQLRITQVKPFLSDNVDLLLLHGLNVGYSVSPRIKIGLEDISLYMQQTMLGNRYAITGGPAMSYSIFPFKRLQLGAIAGASLQGRVGCEKAARMSVAPYAAIFNEVWVRNHFSISPILRINYAAYGPYYTTALSQHSGVLPQGAVWMDFGIGYNFNF